ncbi:helix-turn-helix transcriptional regulator, partial [Nonomuraea fuscirosea]
MVSSPLERALRQDVALWARRGGLLFKQARHAASLNQKALASVSGTSRTTLSAYEHGRKSPTLETAGRILDAEREAAGDRARHVLLGLAHRGRHVVAQS